MHASTSGRSRFRHLFAPLIGALTLVAAVLAGGAGAAIAAPPYATNATVSNLTFTNTQITSGSEQKMTADWSLPDNPATTAGFTIDFPSTMVGRGDTFPLIAQDTGEEMGTCVATPTQLQCDIDSSYIEANPIGLQGKVEFWIKVNDSVETTQEKTYEFGDKQVTVTIVPAPKCTENCDFDWQYRKDGIVDYANGVITWFVHIQSEQGGMLGGEEITIADTPDGNQTLITDVGSPRLMGTNQVAVDGDGVTRPVNFQTLPADQYTVDAENRISFTAQQGYIYQAVYKTAIAEGATFEYYTNQVSVTKNGIVDRVFDGSVQYQGGSGTGIGTNVGVVTITKALDGTAEGLDPEQVFTGTYSVTPPTGSVITGTWSVRAGETWRSPEFPRDSTVTLTEDAPSTPPNVTWQPGEFSTNGFTLPGGKITPVTLTNTADVKLGGFDAAKSVTGDAAATALVPADATFTVDYSYPAGVGFAAGSGSLTLGRDGTPVASPDLPVGAQVTITERTPTAVDGATWGTATITPATFEVSDSARVSVQVENPISQTLGGFSLVKSVTGDGAGLVPAGTVFTVDYEWTASGGRAGEGTVDVVAGADPVSVTDIPVGATVTLSEHNPAQVEGVTWLPAEFSENGFVISSETLVAISLDNPTELQTGTFSASKDITGTEAAQALVPADATFTIDYSYPAGTGFAAGSGSITIGADGTAVSSGPLPFGAQVTLTEQTPAEVPGAAWGTAVITPSTFTVGAGTDVAVTVENPVVETLGSFSLVKSVSGDASGLVPADAVFTVDYAWTHEDGRTGEGTVDVTADGTPVTVAGIPGGAVVTLTEGAPGPVEGVDWLDPIFSENGFSIIAGTTVAIDLDNPTQLQSGAFAIRKQIEGSGSALVPQDSDFTVDYSYPAGEGFEAGSGQVTVKADGVVVMSDPLPYGAVVTLTEADPTAVTNGEWTGATFDTDTVTIGDGTVVNVVLTNTIDDVTPPAETIPPTPGTPDTTTPPGLAQTGGEWDTAATIWIAAALLLAGATTILITRRTRAIAHTTTHNRD